MSFQGINLKDMELKEFIKTAIADITNAVSELQGELKNGVVFPSAHVKASLEAMRDRRTKRLPVHTAESIDTPSGK